MFRCRIAMLIGWKSELRAGPIVAPCRNRHRTNRPLFVYSAKASAFNPYSPVGSVLAPPTASRTRADRRCRSLQATFSGVFFTRLPLLISFRRVGLVSR
uniref:Putative secreted protein n=1 Tax=Anopheles darlingi TaxID=43151 RepID=A0A2M4DK30_ANODA